MAKKKQVQVRAILSDKSLEAGQLGQVGELVTVYTSTRAWRGALAARTGEVLILAAPMLVWRGDPENIGAGPAVYFVRGALPVAAQEEPSGARCVVLPISGIVYVCAHGIEAPSIGAMPKFDEHGYPGAGETVHLCSVTHEARGTIASLIPGEFVELADDDQQAIVNRIEDNQFASVLAGTSKGSDHFSTQGLRFALHALTALVVR